MLKRSYTSSRGLNRQRDGRIRIKIKPSLDDRLQRRLDEEGVSLSEYLQHLIRVDTGAYAGTHTY